jgi:CubicO group peptidase (beta-lactamase class C family)
MMDPNRLEDGVTQTLAPSPLVADRHRRDSLALAFPEVDRVFADFRERWRIPGVAYGIVVDGELVHAQGVGNRDLGGELPVDRDSVFQIASVTKSVTAMCVLILRDEGRLGLDDPVLEYIPELGSLRLPTADSPEVTVRHLLTMSAGLVTDDPWADRQLGLDVEAFGLLLARGVPFDQPPGTCFEYSNLGYAILGRLVSNVAGVPFDRFAAEWVFQPLGMTSSTWTWNRVPDDRVVRGYRLGDGGWVREHGLSNGAFGPAAGLATSIRDFARYVGFHLSAWPPRDQPESGPLRRASVREMHQAWRVCPLDVCADQVQDLRAEGYGYGLVSGIHAADGRFVAHKGGLPGFGAYVHWLPDQGVGLLAFANLTYAPVWEAVWAAMTVLRATGGLAPRRSQPSPALMAARDAVVQLYKRWDAREAASLAAENFYLDLSADRRREQFEDLHATLGACTSVGELIAPGALEGHWRMDCERGTIDISLSLSPTVPPRLQTLDLIASIGQHGE